MRIEYRPVLKILCRRTTLKVVPVVLDRNRNRIDFGGDIFMGIASGADSVFRHARMLGGREWVRFGAIEMGLDCVRRYLYRLPIDRQFDLEKH